jgi:hypothetical protein
VVLTRAPGTCAEPGCAGIPIHRGRCKQHVRWPARNPGRGLDGPQTKRHRARLAREQRGRCARCGRRIPPGSGELHHVDGDPRNDLGEVRIAGERREASGEASFFISGRSERADSRSC